MKVLTDLCCFLGQHQGAVKSGNVFTRLENIMLT